MLVYISYNKFLSIFSLRERKAGNEKMVNYENYSQRYIPIWAQKLFYFNHSETQSNFISISLFALMIDNKNYSGLLLKYDFHLNKMRNINIYMFEK